MGGANTYSLVKTFVLFCYKLYSEPWFERTKERLVLLLQRDEYL